MDPDDTTSISDGGFSLHDLIYNARSSTTTAAPHHDLPSASAPDVPLSSLSSEFHASEPSPPRKKRNWHDDSDRKKPEEQDTTILDRFYQLDQQGQHDSSPPQREPRSKHKQRKRRRRSVHSYDDDDSSVEQETTEQIQARKKKSRQETKYRNIQKRWAQKTVSLHEEVDHGGVVRHAARQTFRKRKRHERTRKRHAMVIESSSSNQGLSGVVQEQAGNQEEVSSDEARRQKALGSLWTSMSQPSAYSTLKSDKEALDDVDDNGDKSDGSSERDYYQLGFAAPRLHDLGDFYYGKHNRFRGIQWKERMKRAKEIQKEPVVLKRRPTKDGEPDPQFYIPLPHPTDSWARTGYFHQRTFRTLASRYLIGFASSMQQPGSDSETVAHRLLQHFSNVSFREVGREYLLMNQVKERGLDYVTFQSNEWKDRGLATLHLGVCPDVVAPPMRVGYTLEQLPLKDSARRHRKKIVSYLGNGPMSQLHGKASKGKGPPGRLILNVGRSDQDERLDQQERYSSHRSSPPLLRSDEEDAKPSAIKFIDASFFIESLPNACNYVHVPGTVPPIPSFPLDESNVVIGGADRNSQVFHVGKVDEATFTTILASLLARLWDAESSADLGAIRQSDSLVSTFFNDVLAKNTLALSSMGAMRRKRTEQPSKLFYIALMGSCSYLANSGGTFIRFSESDENASDVGNKMKIDRETVEANAASPWIDQRQGRTNLGLDKVAEKIYRRCEECPKSSSLTMFPRIHTITGIALVAKQLPPGATEILSRSFDDLHHRTPFDLLRATLEYLESNNMLVDSHRVVEGDECMNVRHLEHMMHEATAIWRQCLDMEPLEADNHSWYIGGLAASLLLCSGNRIGSEARLSPSPREPGGDYETLLLTHDSCIRQHLPKFESVRQTLSAAIRKLLELVPLYGFATLHKAASVLLEWQQVVALLVGPEGATTEPWNSIRDVHATHTVQWALQEKSSLARRRIEELDVGGLLRSDVILSVLASELENDPSDIHRWRALVHRLGPFGSHVSPQQSQHCRTMECPQCPRLRSELGLDHTSMFFRMVTREWWGATRVAWWDTQLLTNPQLDEDSTSRNGRWIKHLPGAIEAQLRKEKGVTLQSNRGVAVQGVGLNWTQDHLNLDWLDISIDTSLSGDSTNASNDETYDTFLPKPHRYVVSKSEEMGQAEVTSCLIPALVDVDDEHNIELLCCQLAIICHLYGPFHETIRRGALFLAKSCYSDLSASHSRKMLDTKCLEWQCLVWLYEMGLDVVRILDNATVPGYMPQS